MYPQQPYSPRVYYPPNQATLPYYYPAIYHPYYPYYYRQYPSVNPTMFMSSAVQMQTIMKDASLLLNQMASSKQFSSDLMGAAQESKMQVVTEMIKGTGVVTMPNISYTPDGLKLIFSTKADDVECCNLTLKLRWM